MGDDSAQTSGKVYGAVAREGAKAARSMGTKRGPRPGPVKREEASAPAHPGKKSAPPKKARSTKGKAKSSASGLAVVDQRILNAWGDYERAVRKLLQVTQTSSLNSAATKARGALQRRDAIAREGRRGRNQGGGKSPRLGPSRSVRTVSGGAPGLGKRR